MKTIRILFLLIALFVNKEILFAQESANTIEEIGKHLSELLINRGNIDESQYAIKIERLFPNEDFSDFEDSPAEFILSMMYGAELILPKVWAGLLLQADSLNINENAKYFKTYDNETGNDTFLLTSVLTQSSKYYAFSFIVLQWENSKYVMRIYKKMKEYNNVEELEENVFSIAREEYLDEMKEMEEIENSLFL